jgi:hypothetical protein
MTQTPVSRIRTSDALAMFCGQFNPLQKPQFLFEKIRQINF